MPERNYSAWMEKCVGVNAVLRHDVDFDLDTARSMMEIERSHGLRSIIYLDVNSPSYSLNDIANLCDEFKEFLFGIHVNVAYDYDDQKEGWEKYLKDLKDLQEVVPIDSCVGHYYSPDMVAVPSYTNVDIENASDKEGVMPSFWKRFGFVLGQDGTLLDSRGMDRHPFKWAMSIPTYSSGFMSTHPVNYHKENGSVIYAKRFSKEAITDQDIDRAHTSIKDKLTPYLSNSIEQLLHQKIALTWLKGLIKNRYRELIRVVDAACGIGLLGTYLQRYNNVKYIGVDIEQGFINEGKKMYDRLGFAPKFLWRNIYAGLPEGDVLVCLGYEDCWTDYQKLFEICKNYKDVIISIAGFEMTMEAKTRNKTYNYIGENDFEELFGKSFSISAKINIPQKRTMYWLERKDGSNK